MLKMLKSQALTGIISRRVVRFGTVGVSNTAIDFGMLNLLILSLGITGTGMGLLSCNAAAFIAASLNSYILNKKWTFRETDQASLTQYTIFLSLTVGGLAINSLSIYVVTSLLPDGNALHQTLQINLAKVCATIASMTWNYLAYRQLVFRRSIHPRRQVL